MRNQILAIVKLEAPDLIASISKLPSKGILKTNLHNLTYLNIDDAYIHQSFPFLTDKQANKPDYFSDNKNFIGAHISVIYPEEQTLCDRSYLSREYDFSIEGLFSTFIDEKKYYALKVIAPQLTAIRQAADLPAKPCYKNYLVDLHITIGNSL